MYVLMRQEGARIYKYPSDVMFPSENGLILQEELAYDFSLQERDTIYYPYLFNGLVVAHVDTIMVDGISRRRLTMNLGVGENEIETLADIWVEGIGGAATSPCFFWGAWETSISGMMQSCIQDGRVLFSWDDFFAPGIISSLLQPSKDIFETKQLESSSGIYDLQGRYLPNKLQKGVYIKDGRKYVK